MDIIIITKGHVEKWYSPKNRDRTLKRSTIAYQASSKVSIYIRMNYMYYMLHIYLPPLVNLLVITIMITIITSSMIISTITSSKCHYHYHNNNQLYDLTIIIT